jgi:hypothetical protein
MRCDDADTLVQQTLCIVEGPAPHYSPNMHTTISRKAVLLAVLCGCFLSKVACLVAPTRNQGRTKLRQHQQVAVQPAPGTLNRISALLFMTNEEDSDEKGALSTEREAVEEEKNILQKFNDFLDTPILDANNRSNEGPVKEMLKNFSRDEPELAQISFSVVVILILLVVTKLVTG